MSKIDLNNLPEKAVIEWFSCAIETDYREEFFTIFDNHVPCGENNGVRMYKLEDIEKAFEQTKYRWLIQYFRKKLTEGIRKKVRPSSDKKAIAD